MPEKRPNVFQTNTTNNPIPATSVLPENVIPTSEGLTTILDPTKQTVANIEYDSKKMDVANEVYSTSANETGMAAIEAMRKRTEEQIKLRDIQLQKNLEQTQNYQKKMDVAQERPIAVQPKPKTILTSELKAPINNLNVSNLTMNKTDAYIEQLSQPQYNSPFDVIPLPSEGKIYRNKKSGVKVAYMTTGDENILTSPNLLQSGEFLEILINRKLLDAEIRYKDLHVGDRNAIMLWLRATSYGEQYPVTLFDEEGDPFETIIDLTTLKVKKLGAEPDAEGYFDFMLPLSKVDLKFKLLTVGDLDEIEQLIDVDKQNESIVNNLSVYTLERQIISVNGDRNPSIIRELAQNLRIPDAEALRDYIESIESGVDLELEVRTPRGGSVKTFLPLNVKFFWPKLSL